MLEWTIPSADLKDFSFEMNRFSMALDGETTTASLLFKDLEDYFWNFKMDGNLDLEKITKIIPLEDMDLAGKVKLALETEGRMSALEAERYADLPTSGSIEIQNFNYTSPDLPQGFGITESKASFTPELIQLASFKGKRGSKRI